MYVHVCMHTNVGAHRVGVLWNSSYNVFICMYVCIGAHRIGILETIVIMYLYVCMHIDRW